MPSESRGSYRNTTVHRTADPAIECLRFTFPYHLNQPRDMIAGVVNSEVKLKCHQREQQV